MQKNWCFQIVVLEKSLGSLLEVPWTARRSSQSNLKGMNPEYTLERLMLKLQYLGHLMQSRLIVKYLFVGKYSRQEEKVMT